eukprot:jgi/Chrzof1/4755/Cz14g25020.t1
MALQLHVDLMSQPSRACVIFCKVHDLPVKINLLRIDKLQNRSPEYLALNPLGKVPFLEDGDTIHIPKSAAILCYLAAKFNVGSPWCPPSSDLVARAMFDAAMHWQHTTVRLGCTRLVFNRVLAPLMKRPSNPAVADHGQAVLVDALSTLEQYWLADKDFMTGSDCSLPDLLCCCEIEQCRLLVADPDAPQLQQLLQPVPRVRAWMQRVRAACQPHYDEAHKTLLAAADRMAQQARSKTAARL